MHVHGAGLGLSGADGIGAAVAGDVARHLVEVVLELGLVLGPVGAGQQGQGRKGRSYREAHRGGRCWWCRGGRKGAEELGTPVATACRESGVGRPRMM